MYSELRRISHITGSPRGRYVRYVGFLKRICTEQATDFSGSYSNLFSLLLAVCHARGIDHRAADRFRRNARRVIHEEYTPDKAAELADLADLCLFVQQITGEPIPDDLPQHIRPLRLKSPTAAEHTSLRAVVLSIEKATNTFTCRLADADAECAVEFWQDASQNTPGAENVASNSKQVCSLYVGATVMLLDAQPVTGKTNTLRTHAVVLEPDYLVDVSTLAACIKSYGSSPLNYLLGLFEPNLPTRYKLLGNLANQFLDDCINSANLSDEELYALALKKNFQQYALDYACLDDKEVPPAFFTNARQHFRNILETVRDKFASPDVSLSPDDILLEPAFICPAVGLRGRLDAMTTDHLNVLELKSGRAQEEWHVVTGPREEHRMQMALYGEMLRRNFSIDWDKLHTFLLYSRYPHLYNDRPSAEAIDDALTLRNRILYLLHILRAGRFAEILPRLSPQYLNENHLQGTLFEQYIRPQIEAITKPLAALRDDEPLRDYFTSYVTFVLRELFLSKTTDNRADSVRGFAATWLADRQTKQMAGNLLFGLRLEKVELDPALHAASKLHFLLPTDGDCEVPNFNLGEMVQVYLAPDPHANVTNQQLIRAAVVEISDVRLVVELSIKQRNLHLFPLTKLYAVEHDSSDSPTLCQLRNLFSLLTATPSRRDLFLGRRKPAANPRKMLCAKHPEAVSKIVLQAKRAEDYFLLVGPPGAGKTNIALRAMVREFLASHASEAPEHAPALLLAAYTNRAVDEICEMLSTLSREETPFDFLRIGSPQTCAPAHRPHLLCERAAALRNRSEVRQLLCQTRIFVGTVLTLTNQQILFRLRHFATAILDEASQILEPQALGLICAKGTNGENAIDKFILIGDHKQLPAVVLQSATQTCVRSKHLQAMHLYDLRNSLFERLHSAEIAAHRTDFVATLTHQGRMHADICQFVSKHFYNSQLLPVPLPHQVAPLPWHAASGKLKTFVAHTRVGFLQVKQQNGVENLRANAPEAEIVAKLVDTLCQLHTENHLPNFSPAHSVGIIVPFRSQIACIRRALQAHTIPEAAAITIDTVECFQGSQRDYILFSTTISEPYQLDILSSTQRVGGAEIDRKLNVALSRARLQLFILGDEDILRRSPIYRALLQDATHYEP